MNDLVHIQNTDISVKEYRGQLSTGTKLVSEKGKITSYVKRTKQNLSSMYQLRTEFCY